MDIVHVTPEMAPLAKVGGLADVTYGLSYALSHNDQNVEVILPKYSLINYLPLTETIPGRTLFFTFEEQRCQIKIWHSQLERIKITLIEAENDFFQREEIYGYSNDVPRFLFFCLAATTYLRARKERPDVVHLHDWPTALMAMLLKQEERPLKTLLTIHNLSHQGKYSCDILQHVGLENRYPSLLDDHQPRDINLLKAGISFADKVTTVSPTYAKEILTPLGSQGLFATLLKHQHKIEGILNGIETHFWNPQTDPLVPYNYTKEELSEHLPFLENKKKNKEHLCKMVGLQEDETPLVCAVTRLVEQKGPELIHHAFTHALKMGAKCIMLGSVADQATKRLFDSLKWMPRERLFLEFNYNETLAHLVYAASDLLVIPSLFEPCGLTQMIGMRYGTLPLVRHTGGLVDTVFDVDDPQQSAPNGFTFAAPTKEELTVALNRALSYYRTPTWLKLMHSGMEHDWSWNQPAQKYIEMYKTVKETA